MLQIYFLIDHHYKTESELNDMLKNSPNFTELPAPQDAPLVLVIEGTFLLVFFVTQVNSIRYRYYFSLTSLRNRYLKSCIHVKTINWFSFD